MSSSPPLFGFYFRVSCRRWGWEGEVDGPFCPGLKLPCFGTPDLHLPSSLPTSTAAKFRWGEKLHGEIFLCTVCQYWRGPNQTLFALVSLLNRSSKQAWGLVGKEEEEQKRGGKWKGEVARKRGESGWGFAKINAWMLSLRDWHLWSVL